MTNILPSKIDTFILAEALRPEPGGKISILGAFAAAIVRLPPGTKFPVNVTLALYMLFRDGEGTFDAKIKLIPPGGAVAGPFQIPTSVKEPGQPFTLLVNFPIFSLTAVGKYSIQVFLDDKQYNEEFTVAISKTPITQ
jgi:hypothetical protein